MAPFAIFCDGVASLDNQRSTLQRGIVGVALHKSSSSGLLLPAVSFWLLREVAVVHSGARAAPQTLSSFASAQPFTSPEHFMCCNCHLAMDLSELGFTALRTVSYTAVLMLHSWHSLASPQTRPSALQSRPRCPRASSCPLSVLATACVARFDGCAFGASRARIQRALRGLRCAESMEGSWPVQPSSE